MDATMVPNQDNLCEIELIKGKEKPMTEKPKQEKESVTQGQKIFDNIWLLFVLSLLISTLIYNVWGIVDLLNVPPAP